MNMPSCTNVTGVSISGLQAMEPGVLETLPKIWLRNISNGINPQPMTNITLNSIRVERKPISSLVTEAIKQKIETHD
jgi:hypothetical protein